MLIRTPQNRIEKTPFQNLIKRMIILVTHDSLGRIEIRKGLIWTKINFGTAFVQPDRQLDLLTSPSGYIFTFSFICLKVRVELCASRVFLLMDIHSHPLLTRARSGRYRVFICASGSSSSLSASKAGIGDIGEELSFGCCWLLFFVFLTLFLSALGSVISDSVFTPSVHRPYKLQSICLRWGCFEGIEKLFLGKYILLSRPLRNSN